LARSFPNWRGFPTYRLLKLTENQRLGSSITRDLGGAERVGNGLLCDRCSNPQRSGGTYGQDPMRSCRFRPIAASLYNHGTYYVRSAAGSTPGERTKPGSRNRLRPRHDDPARRKRNYVLTLGREPPQSPPDTRRNFNRRNLWCGDPRPVWDLNGVWTGRESARVPTREHDVVAFARKSATSTVQTDTIRVRVPAGRIDVAATKPKAFAERNYGIEEGLQTC
jgi:hypothetical protein